MIINTRDFGEIDIQNDKVYHFTQPIFGFEEFTEFVILHDEEIGDLVHLHEYQNILLDKIGS